MRLEKKFGICLVLLLLVSMGVVVTATPWDGTPDDPTPAQAIWIDPKNTTGLWVGNTFVADVLINITDPDGGGPATGMWSFQYKLKWNNTVLEAVEIQTHTDNVPSGDLLSTWSDVYPAVNNTGSLNGEGYHSYGILAKAGVGFTGVASLCTYKFKVKSPELFCGLLNIYDDLLMDDLISMPIPHTTVDGTYFIIDLNGDCIVNIQDVGICALALGSELGDPKWDERADLNNDGVINIIDLVRIGIHFGETC